MRRVELGWVALAAVALLGCPDDDGGDGGTSDCALLCDKVANCTERFWSAHESEPDVPVTCKWKDYDDAVRECQAGCEATLERPAAVLCVDCMAERLVCDSTGPLRPCDSDCSPTVYATANDPEGAPVYEYWSWFYGEVMQEGKWECEEL